MKRSDGLYFLVLCIYYDVIMIPENLRSIYSYQFAELGKGKTNQPLKRGKKISQGTTIRKGEREKEKKNREKRPSSGKKRGKQ